MAPLPGLEVRVIEAASGAIRSGVTGPFGAYRVGGLPAATYIVYVPALRKYYPDTYKREEARAVRVDEPAEVGGVNLTGVPGGACQLSPIARGTITGRVFGPALSVDTLRVRAWSDRDTVEAAVGDGGNYAVTCLPAGSYRVALLPAGRVRAQYHPRVYLPAQAVPVSVAAAETTDAINFDPEAGIVLTGRVLDGVTGSALAGVRVRAVELATREEAWSRTDESGSFVLDRRGELTQGSMRTGLPAGRWRVEADSTLVPDPTVTPVWQPSLEARRVDAGIELRWSLAEEATWAVRMERERADGSATLILQRDVAPGGSGEFIDRPEEAGRVRYALSAWPQWPGAEPGPGADEPYRAWSDWIEPAGSGAGASGGAIGRIRALPTPWARERPLLLRCIPGPVSGGTLDLIAATGRRVTELRWPAGADEISWNGRDQEGRRVPSGLYLCRLRTGGSVAATGTILLLDSAP